MKFLLKTEKTELLLQRHKHKANALIRSADLFAGHILLGAVSAVERDAEAMHHHHKLAMSHGNESPMERQWIPAFAEMREKNLIINRVQQKDCPRLSS